MKLLVAASIALLASACGGDGLSGIYQTTSVTNDAAGCGTGTSSATPAFVMVQESSFLGQTVLKVKFCTSADPASCAENDSALATQGLLDAEGKGGGAGGFTMGTSCAISGAFVTATRDGDVLTIKAERKEGTVAGECADRKLTDHESELMCTANQSITATRVGDAPRGTDNKITI